MVKKLIMFDLDGVLVDACDWHRDAFLEAIRPVRIMSAEEHDANLKALPTKTKLDILNIPEEYRAQIEENKQHSTLSLIYKNCKRDDRLCFLLDRLCRDGHILACVTNSIRLTAKIMLKQSGLNSYLDMLVTNEDVWLPKPNPEGYMKVMTAYRMSPKDSIIVEDSDRGAEAGLRTGATVVRVLNSNYLNLDLLRQYL